MLSGVRGIIQVDTNLKQESKHVVIFASVCYLRIAYVICVSCFDICVLLIYTTQILIYLKFERTIKTNYELSDIIFYSSNFLTNSFFYTASVQFSTKLSFSQQQEVKFHNVR